MSLTPALFTSPKQDGTDTTKLRPSNWNDLISLVNSAFDGSVPGGTLKLRVGNGSPSAPSLTFGNEPTLGFYRLDADSIGFAGSVGSFGSLRYKPADPTNGGFDRVVLFMGNGQTVSGGTDDCYTTTIGQAAPNLNTGNRSVIFINIGRSRVIATDQVTRTGQFCTIENDMMNVEQQGGAVTFNDVCNTRFRFNPPTTGVTIIDNKGIDFVMPGAFATGTVVNYKAINIRTMASGILAGANAYGIWFEDQPTASIASAGNSSISIIPGGTGTVDLPKDNITNATAGVKILNRTAATAGVPVQVSPSLLFQGAAWNSSSGLSETDRWSIDALPITNAGATTCTLRFGRSINGGQRPLSCSSTRAAGSPARR